MTGHLSTTAPTPSTTNLHRVFNEHGVTTTHFGTWEAPIALEAAQQLVTSDPLETLAAALAFLADPPSDFLVTVFLPLVDVAFIDRPGALGGVDGFKGSALRCSDYADYVPPVHYYMNCPRQIYLASRKFEAGQLLAPLLTALNAAGAFTVHTFDHGGISEHLHSNSQPRTFMRGEQYSLYDGGIRVRLRYNRGPYPPLAAQSVPANAVDLLSTLTALLAGQQGSSGSTSSPTSALGWAASSVSPDGVNLFLANEARPSPLQWTTDRAASAGHCSNVSPPRALRVVVTGVPPLMVLFGSERTEAYWWNSPYYQLYQATGLPVPTQSLVPSGSRPHFDFAGCVSPPSDWNPQLSKPTPAPVLRGTHRPTPPTTPRAIIIFLCDDVGYGDTQVTSGQAPGPTYPTTPNIMNLAAAGLTFNAFYGGRECSPGRASLMSGRYPHHVDVGVHAVFPVTPYAESTGLTRYLGHNVPGMTFLSSFFADNGYAVGLYGKWHLQFGEEPGPGDAIYGFTDYKCYQCDAPASNSYDNHQEFFSSWATQQFTTDAVAFLNKHVVLSGGQALVLVTAQLSHAPMNLGSQLFTDFGYANSGNPYEINGTQLLAGGQKPYQIIYTAMGVVDAQVGLLQDWASSNGLDAQTIFVFTSDNGAEFRDAYFANAGSPGPHRGGKRSVREGGIHVPFVIKWTGVVPAGVSTGIVATLADLYPTLAGLAGLDISTAADAPRLDGVDLSGCLVAAGGNCTAAARAINTRAVLFESRRINVHSSCADSAYRHAVRVGDLKLYLQSTHKLPPPQDTFSALELFDVLADPFETTDLAAQLPDEVARLTAALQAWPFYDASRWPAVIDVQPWTFTDANMFAWYPCFPNGVTPAGLCPGDTAC